MHRLDRRFRRRHLPAGFGSSSWKNVCKTEGFYVFRTGSMRREVKTAVCPWPSLVNGSALCKVILRFAFSFIPLL
jgi:hypothetical protein